jgi:hypothetical protein
VTHPVTSRAMGPAPENPDPVARGTIPRAWGLLPPVTNHNLTVIEQCPSPRTMSMLGMVRFDHKIVIGGMRFEHAMLKLHAMLKTQPMLKLHAMRFQHGMRLEHSKIVAGRGAKKHFYCWRRFNPASFSLYTIHIESPLVFYQLLYISSPPYLLDWVPPPLSPDFPCSPPRWRRTWGVPYGSSTRSRSHIKIRPRILID